MTIIRSDQVPVTGSYRGPVAGVNGELPAALSDLALLAVSGVAGCDGAGVSLAHDGVVSTFAASSPRVLAVDRVQYRGGDGPCLTALRDGVVVTVGDMAADRRWPAVRAEALAAGVHSSLSVPLLDGEEVVGALNMYGTAVHAFDTASRLAAEALARQGAYTLRYLRLLHQERAARATEHGVALQWSLLPMPSQEGLSCVTRYRAAGSGTKIGGEWCDMFALPDGTVGVAVGDVTGHGVTAAVAMSQLRSVLRFCAYEGSSPAAVLDRMDRFVQGFDAAQIATTVYARLALDQAGATMLYANAGHLPPLLQQPDGTVRRLNGATSALIGVRPTGLRARPEAAVELPAGSTLLLYTDGLVEGPQLDLDDGLDQLERAVAAHDPADGPDALCRRILDTTATDSADDMALLAVHITGARAPA